MSLEEKDLEFSIATEGGVPYRLLPGYPTFFASSEESGAEECYLIPGEYLDQFLEESFPPEDDDGTNNNRIMPGSPWMRTDTVVLKPFNDRIGDPYGFIADRMEAVTKYYRAEITYKPITEPENPDDRGFSEHLVKAGGEFLSIPGKKVVLSSPGDLPGQSSIPDSQQPNPNTIAPIILILPGFQHTLKFNRISRPDWIRIRNNLGRTNSVAFQFNPDYSSPPYTLLFVGLTASRKYAWSGRRLRVYPWQMEFQFSERCVEDDGWRLTWNHVYSSEIGWKQATRQGGLNLYDSAPFAEMLTTRRGQPTAGL